LILIFDFFLISMKTILEFRRIPLLISIFPFLNHPCSESDAAPPPSPSTRPTIPPLVIPLRGSERERTGSGTPLYADATTSLEVDSQAGRDGSDLSDSDVDGSFASAGQHDPVVLTEGEDGPVGKARQSVDQSLDKSVDHQSVDHQSVDTSVDHQSVETSVDHQSVEHQSVDQGKTQAGETQGAATPVAAAELPVDESTTWTVSLRCPLSKKRMSDPVIGADCKHRHRCFDRVTMHCAWPSGYRKCPVCKKPVDLGTLVTDTIVLAALSAMPGNTVEISGDEGHIRDPEETLWRRLA
jgi:hypothetical protein